MNFVVVLIPLLLSLAVAVPGNLDLDHDMFTVGEAVDGELDVHAYHTATSQVVSYALRLDDDNTIRNLVFPAPLPGYVGSGSKLTVRAHVRRGNADDADPSTMHVAEFDVRELGDGGRDFPTPGEGAVALQSITWILNVCGRMAAATPQSVAAKWFEDPAKPQQQSLEGYYNQCSYGKVSFTRPNNVIVGPIDVPCYGHMTGGYPYGAPGAGANTCSSTDVYAWAEFAQNYSVNVLGMNLAPYTRRIVILPDTQACQWAGLGSVGCGSYCYTWLLSAYALGLATTFHELGHNLGLQHSTTPTDEYGDNSCAMASDAGVRCFNAPQLWRLGWAKTAVPTYDATTLTPGVWHTHVLHAEAVSDASMLRIYTSWATTTPATAFFVSYRQAIEYDRGLVAPYRYKVFVHKYQGQVGVLTGDKPELQTLSGLAAGSSYTDVLGQWRVNVLDITTASNSSTVSLCRFTSAVETDCFNGLDDDCNGLTDAQDPACTGVPLSPPPPPWSKPSPPPPPPGPPTPYVVTCGDGKCDVGKGETNVNCPVDCCSHKCGDGVCNTYAENCHTCPKDCATVGTTVCCGLTTGTMPACGAGACGKCTDTCIW